MKTKIYTKTAVLFVVICFFSVETFACLDIQIVVATRNGRILTQIYLYLNNLLLQQYVYIKYEHLKVR